MEEPQLNYHISWTVGGILIGITTLCWLLQFLLTLTLVLIPWAIGIGEAATWICELIFLFIMKKNFMRGKRMLQRILALFAGTAGGFIPIINCLIPILPFNTLYQVYCYRADDYDRYQTAHAWWEKQMREQEVQEQNEYIAAMISARANDSQRLEEEAA